MLFVAGVAAVSGRTANLAPRFAGLLPFEVWTGRARLSERPMHYPSIASTVSLMWKTGLLRRERDGAYISHWDACAEMRGEIHSRQDVCVGQSVMGPSFPIGAAAALFAFTSYRDVPLVCMGSCVRACVHAFVVACMSACIYIHIYVYIVCRPGRPGSPFGTKGRVAL